MRVYDYEEWVRQRRGSTRAIAVLSETPCVRGRRRTAEETRALERAAFAGMLARARDGRLRRVGVREYELRV